MQFTQEFVRWDEEWIHVEQAPNKHHRMRAQDIHHDPSVDLGGVVDADDRIAVLRHDVIEPGLVPHVLHHVVDRPGYVPDTTGAREATSRGSFLHLLDQGEHVIVDEAASAEIGLVPGVKFELAMRRGGGNWDPRILE